MSSTNTPLDALFNAPAVNKQGYFNFQWKQYLADQNSGLGGAAPVQSPVLAGTPTAPTATPLTNSSQIATTKYADSAVAVETTRAEAKETTLQGAITAETARAMAAENVLSGEVTTINAKLPTLAPIANPIFTGTVEIPVLDLTGAIISTATGGAVTPPATGQGFVIVNVGGSPFKMFLWNV